VTRLVRYRMGPEARLERARRAQRAIWVLAMLLATVGLFLGCGDRRLVTQVDVYSFLDSTETSGAYGPVPAGASGVTGFAQNRELNLLSGVEGVVTVESVELHTAGLFVNQTGAGDAQLVAVFRRVTGEPVDSLVSPIRLEAGRTDLLDVQVPGSAGLAQLLTGSELRLDLRLELAADPPPGNLDPLQGDFQLTRLLAVVVARRDTN
jgi:hypothetical protein